MTSYRVGIIGCGFIGKVHAFAYNNLQFYYDPLPLDAKITHVVTSCQDTAEKSMRLVGAQVAATDYRVVTENRDVDIVHICTPNHLHREALLSAMRHEKHIYCDKPLVATWTEAKEVEAALDHYPGTAQMTFQNRFFPAVLRAKRWVEQGGLGEVLGFRACYLHSGSVAPDVPLKWKLSSASGGGVIADLASHVFDFVEYLAGRIGAVMADTHVAYPHRPSIRDRSQRVAVDAEDSVVLLARLETGALGSIEATKIATGSEDELRVEIHGSRGALRFNLMDPHHLELYDSTAVDQPLGGERGWTRIDTGQRYEVPATSFPTPKASIGWLRAHVACLANFLQAVADRRPADPDLRQGVRNQWLIECVRQSAAQRKWIEVG